MVIEDPTEDVRGLYTAAMLAELLGISVSAIRRWVRRDYLVVSVEVHRVAYLATGELHVARLLAEILKSGCSLAGIDTKMGELTRVLPGVARPLCELPIVVEGQQLLLRRGDDLTEPSGQLLLNFDVTEDQGAAASPVQAIPFDRENLPAGDECSVEQLRDFAGDLEDKGDFQGALDYHRSIVVAGSGAAEDHFALGNVLYQTGDLPAARERFYMAIELDDDYVEARLNLGCVLVELNEPDLAEAAYRGALDCHPDYADVHYHLARLLDHLGRCSEALIHWAHFRDLTPKSPWAEEAQDRLSTVE